MGRVYPEYFTQWSVLAARNKKLSLFYLLDKEKQLQAAATIALQYY